MTPQNPATECPQSTPSIPSPFRARSSQIRAYITKRRWWLWTGVVLVLAAMVIGIIFGAHRAYFSFGGQGFLKREEPPQLSTFFPPLRATQKEDHEVRRANVPYYICGDQLHSCEAHNQPNICCPINTFCYPTKFSPSEIFCCNSTMLSECHTSEENKPICLPNTFQCSAKAGGGCCPHSTICAPNGCIKIVGPSIVSDDELATSTSSNSEPYSIITTIVDGNAAADTGKAIVSTITERPAATMTGVKQGEVAQNGVSQPYPSAFLGLCLPYFSAILVVSVALMMGWL